MVLKLLLYFQLSCNFIVRATRSWLLNFYVCQNTLPLTGVFLKLIISLPQRSRLMYLRGFLILSFTFRLFRCIALTAELTNGTFVGMRGCTSSGTVDCNAEGCDEYNKTLSGPVYFTRCVAECCSTSRCNKNLFPMLTGPSSTVPDMVVSSTAVPNTHPGTTQPPKGSTTFTSAGIKIKALLYLLLFLLVVLGIMS